MSRLLLGAVLLAPFWPLSQTPQQSSIAERAAGLILNAPAAANAVWPGFSLSDRDFLIYDATGAYLVTRSKPPASFAARGRVFFHAGALPGLDGNMSLAYRLGDLTVIAVTASTSPERTVEVLYHEAFHVFQRERFSFSTATTADASPAITRDVAASIEVERRALRDAIRATGPDENWIRPAIAVRARRSAMTDEAFRIVERDAERREGLADYVETHSAAIALGRSARGTIDRIAARLAMPLRGAGGSPDERLVRTRAYGTGAAMAVLLDRLGVDWKRRAESEPLDALLARRLPLSTERAAALAAEADRRYGYQALLVSNNPPWGELRGLSERDFDALGPFKLVLETTPAIKTAWSLRASSERLSGMHRPSPGILLLPMASRFTASGPGFSAVITNRPVRMDMAAPSGAGSAITILLEAAPRLNGRPAATDLDATLSGVSIEADGVRVTIAGPVRLTSRPGSLRVAPIG